MKTSALPTCVEAIHNRRYYDAIRMRHMHRFDAFNFKLTIALANLNLLTAAAALPHSTASIHALWTHLSRSRCRWSVSSSMGDWTVMAVRSDVPVLRLPRHHGPMQCQVS